MLGPHHYVFLNEAHTVPKGEWDPQSLEKLWRYNLHYFDDLNAQEAAERNAWHSEWVSRWIAENAPGHGTGWEPYPVSLRVVNWIKWFASGQQPEPRWLDSLATQVRWLTGRLEWHLMGNHLFVNAKALLMAGLYFEGPEAQDWLARGLAILEPQLTEQVLPDGGQFERSPMYHALALEDLLDLINMMRVTSGESAAGARLPRLREVAARMLYWQRAMCHQGGELALFNDCADGIAPPLQELERVAQALDIQATQPESGILHFPDSGYAAWRCAPALLLVDVAPLGPDYLVGHAHADTLAFELAVAGRRIVVNGGTSCYGTGASRLAERGTSAHSTVCVAGQDSSEVWSGFRVGRRAYPLGLDIGAGHIRCSHNGYRYLPGAPVHQRTWSLLVTGLRVDDQLSDARVSAQARYPLAAGLLLQQLRESVFAVKHNDNVLCTVYVDVGQGRVEDTQHALRFGVVQANQTLCVTLVNGRATTRWEWTQDAHPVPH
jgi:uncharacterized heparinase superfamily protein